MSNYEKIQDVAQNISYHKDKMIEEVEKILPLDLSTTNLIFLSKRLGNIIADLELYRDYFKSKL